MEMGGKWKMVGSYPSLMEIKRRLSHHLYIYFFISPGITVLCMALNKKSFFLLLLYNPLLGGVYTLLGVIRCGSSTEAEDKIEGTCKQKPVVRFCKCLVEQFSHPPMAKTVASWRSSCA